MADETLGTLLESLHRKLAATPALGDTDRAALQQLANDIQSALAQSGGTTRSQGVLDRLEAAAIQFEGSHPELTATIMQVSKALGDMGI